MVGYMGKVTYHFAIFIGSHYAKMALAGLEDHESED
jgi:hypothetical protein